MRIFGSIVAGAALVACLGPPAHVVVSVEDPDRIAGDLRVLVAGARLGDLRAVELERRAFPLSVTVAGGAPGQRTVWIEARDAAGRALGRGKTVARFATRGYPTATVRLSRACDGDADCGDGSFCNGAERCDDGICGPPGPPPCGSSVACVTSACVELDGGAGACDVTVDHAVCGPDEYCDPLIGCLPGLGCHDDLECDDGSVCNGVERCIGFLCRPSDPPAHDDGDDCTTDGCNEDDGVFHVTLAAREGNTCVKLGGAREICLASAGGCVPSSCGDGYVDTDLVPAERCDDGPANSASWAEGAACNMTCSGFAPYCGDGVVNGAEVCDDGNTTSDGNDCDPRCGCEGIACFDLVWTGEGGAEFGPRDERITWGSAGCPGLTTMPLGQVARWVREGSGPQHLAHLDVGASGRELVLRQWTGTDLPVVQRWPFTFTDRLWTLDPAQLADPVLAWMSGAPVSDPEIHVGRWTGTSWVEVGAGSMGAAGVSNTPAYSTSPRIFYRGPDDILLFWLEKATTSRYDIFVRRFDGVAWGELGAGSASGGGITAATAGAFNYDVALDPQGNPIVVWPNRVATNNYEVYVLRWTGSAWAELGSGSASGGGISVTTTYSMNPTVAVMANGDVVVAWDEGGLITPHEIFVKRWTGTAWGALGAGSASGGGVSNDVADSARPSLTVSDTGGIHLAWLNEVSSGGVNTVSLRWFDGTQWQVVGGAATPPFSGGGTPQIAVDVSGDLHVAWSTWGQEGMRVLTGVLDDGVWRPHIAGSAGVNALSTPGDSTAPSIVLDADLRPVVAWSEQTQTSTEIYVMRYDGEAWIALGGSATGGGVSNSAAPSMTPKLALDGAGRPVVVWVEGSGGVRRVQLRRWSGSAWEQLGDSASATGLSNNLDSAEQPAIAAGPGEELFVAWYDWGWNFNGDVYLKRWTGSAWTELAGSASTGGVTQEQGYAAWYSPRGPAVVADADGHPIIAWEYGFERQIYAMRWDGLAWVEIGAGSASGGFGLSYSGGAPEGPMLSVAPDGHLYAGWWDSLEQNGAIYVWEWNGSSWNILAGGADQHRSASGSGAEAGLASMALDEHGRPFVAWETSAIGDTSADAGSEIAVRRWTRDRWVDVGEGAATGGGISNAACASTEPALAVRGGKACVAWSEEGMWSRDIVVRCTEWR